MEIENALSLESVYGEDRMKGYGNTLKDWLSKYNHLSEQEIALCYFCYIGIKHNNQAVFFGLSPQSLSKRKQRLKNKLAIPQSRSLKDAIINTEYTIL